MLNKVRIMGYIGDMFSTTIFFNDSTWVIVPHSSDDWFDKLVKELCDRTGLKARNVRKILRKWYK